MEERGMEERGMEEWGTGNGERGTGNGLISIGFGQSIVTSKFSSIASIFIDCYRFSLIS